MLLVWISLAVSVAAVVVTGVRTGRRGWATFKDSRRFTGALGTRSFGSDDFRARLPRFSPEAMVANQTLVAAVVAVADRYEATPAQIALAWLLAQGPQVIPIPGTKRVGRLEENAGAGALELSAADLAELDDLPAPSGGRY